MKRIIRIPNDIFFAEICDILTSYFWQHLNVIYFFFLWFFRIAFIYNLDDFFIKKKLGFVWFLRIAFILFKTWLVCRVIEAGDVRINICYSWWDFPIWWILSTKISEASFFTLISIFLFLGLLFIRPLNIVLKVIFSIVFIILTWFY